MHLRNNVLHENNQIQMYSINFTKSQFLPLFKKNKADINK